MKKDDDRYDFQIVHHFIDLNELTLKKIPVGLLKVIVIVFINIQKSFRLKYLQNQRSRAGSEGHPSP